MGRPHRGTRYTLSTGAAHSEIGLLRKGDALDPRQVKQAVLGGEHLGDRHPPASTAPAPTAPALVHPGRRGRETSWVALALEAHSLLPGPGILEQLLLILLNNLEPPLWPLTDKT